MAHDSTTFDFDFSLEDEPYNPLADSAEDREDAGEEGVDVFRLLSKTPVTIQPDIETPAQDKRSASERIEALFAKMPQRRRVLVGILRYLCERRTADEVFAEVISLQKYDASVYTGTDYCNLLERAGAIVKVDENGAEISPESKRQPERVEVEGQIFLKPAEPLVVRWAITEDGQAYVDADNPLDNLLSLIKENEMYLPVYERVLKFCANEGGRATSSISDIVESDPLVQEPRLYAAHFVKQLEDSDALVWQGGWRTTDVGRKGLEKFAAISIEEE